jgi:hypothetical protein
MTGTRSGSGMGRFARAEGPVMLANWLANLFAKPFARSLAKCA